MKDNLERFRSELRNWLESNCPSPIRHTGAALVSWGGRRRAGQDLDGVRWMEAMASRGFTAPTWPTAYGGAGLDEAKAAVLGQELRRIGAPPALYSYGLWMLGPVLLEYGSEAQRLRHLPPIARGEIRWCQGYSEPGAGSDLAALQTRCDDMGDHWLVNGQKIWTSDAHVSDWMFCLVRTDRSVKQAGISFVLIDLETPGVERRPIKLISGASPFCETFFTDVRVPKDQMVGPLNGGWEIAKRLLQYERRMISDVGQAVAPLREALAGHADALQGERRERAVRLDMREHALGLTLERAGQAGGVSNLASALKVAGSIARQDRHELLVDLLGLDSLRAPEEGGDSEAAGESEARHWLRSRSATIEGGTTEINLNVIAKRILQLPDPR
jgi:alkylation response protein AidB-like acyl-CoA dehydrogenase